MSMKWGAKSTVALGMFCLLAGWQLSPIFAKDAESATKSTGDSDWSNCLRHHIAKKFFSAINASKEQEEQLSGIIDDTAEKNSGLRSQMKDKVMAIIDAFSDESTTNDQLKQKVADLKAVRDKLMDARVESALKARALLTADQRKTLASRVKMRAEFWMNR